MECGGARDPARSPGRTHFALRNALYLVPNRDTMGAGNIVSMLQMSLYYSFSLA